MTTAPSMAFSTMEVPALDDNMEMTSPYQGHVDDFDIDLDIMEDQASNADRDMMGDDEYLEGTHETEYNQDGANDEDMIDEVAEQVAEPTMTDADDQEPETSNSVDMQYGAEKTYEAEMVEDDYDEDIDAPVPDSLEEIPPAQQENKQETKQEEPMTEANESVEDAGSKPTVEPNNIAHIEPAPEPAPEPNQTQEDLEQQDQQQHIHHSEENVVQESDAIQPAPEVPEKSLHDTNEAEQVDFQEVNQEVHQEVQAADIGEDNTASKQSDHNEDDAGEIQSLVHEQKDIGEEKAEEKELDAAEAEESEHGPDTSNHAPALYPVKVYYQENEISLFPPREGDASETFFLEDERLAYEPLQKLFESCRQVLHEHIEDNEILVMDIEALNIQLTEDSSNTSKATLYQIVDVYLQLCHNDGIGEPEALYLTLSTRLTIAAEVSNLLAAASEGKGLSEVYLWDDYQEADVFSPENHEGPDQVQSLEEPQQDTSEQKDDRQLETLEAPEIIPDAKAQESSGIPDEQEHEVDAGLTQDDNEASTAYSGEHVEINNTEESGTQEVPQPEIEKTEIRNDGSPDEGSYDSEEQNTESTATITALPADGYNEQQYADESAHVSNDDHESHDAHDGYREAEENDDEDYIELEDDPNTSGDVGDSGEVQHDVATDDHANDGTEPHVEESDEGLVHEYNGEPHAEGDKTGAASQHDEQNTEETTQEVDGGTVPENTEHELEEPTQDVPASNAQPSLNTADDSLGAVEEPLESPAKDSHDVDQDIESSHEPGEIFDEEEDVSLLDPSKHETDELTFDDAEYLDLGITDEFDFADEETGTKSPGHASTKRNREPEDELELAESPTPDAKRSRSS